MPEIDLAAASAARDLAHVWMSHGTHVGSRVIKSWHTCDWVMAHVWLSHGTRVIESWHTCEQRPGLPVIDSAAASAVLTECEWVMAHVWINHGTHLDARNRFGCGVSSARSGTRVDESRHMCDWVMAHTNKNHFKHMNMSWHTCKCRALLLICTDRLRIWWHVCIRVYVGLFCRYVGLFCRYVGLFYEWCVRIVCGYVDMCV